MSNVSVAASRLVWPKEAIPTVDPSTPLPFALTSVGRTFGFGVACDADGKFVGLVDSAHIEERLLQTGADVVCETVKEYLLYPGKPIPASANISDVTSADNEAAFLPVEDAEGQFLGLLRMSDLHSRELRP